MYGCFIHPFISLGFINHWSWSWFSSNGRWCLSKASSSRASIAGSFCRACRWRLSRLHQFKNLLHFCDSAFIQVLDYLNVMMKWNQNTSMLKFDLIFSRYHMLHKHFNHFCMILQNNNSFAIVSLYAINRNIYKRYAGVQWIWCMVVFIIIVPRCVVVCKTHISNAQTTQGNKCGYVFFWKFHLLLG